MHGEAETGEQHLRVYFLPCCDGRPNLIALFFRFRLRGQFHFLQFVQRVAQFVARLVRQRSACVEGTELRLGVRVLSADASACVE